MLICDKLVEVSSIAAATLRTLLDDCSTALAIVEMPPSSCANDARALP
ncbi:MAG: hypothetical protein QF570_17050 [Myxococcota bacterium]|nr:hypothetical protein [Myxococcota bacterium]